MFVNLRFGYISFSIDCYLQNILFICTDYGVIFCKFYKIAPSDFPEVHKLVGTSMYRFSLLTCRFTVNIMFVCNACSRKKTNEYDYHSPIHVIVKKRY